ncbi:unnamed protein product [Peniophora sp. CBMAI 1063]|nr:unnamed protein product [Peniophora sp. CBMAI 1063]
MIWALWLTSFYNTAVFNAFLRRAGQAALWIDLGLLDENANGRAPRSDVIAAITAPELLTRAYAIVTNDRQNCRIRYYATLVSRLCSVPLKHLRILDIFLAKEYDVPEPISAPCLEQLSVTSDAEDFADCPLSIDKLQYLFDSSRHLAVVRLRRCVDTRALDDASVQSAHTRTRLRELHIESMDEDLLKVIHAYFTVGHNSSVLIDVRAPSLLTSAIELSFSRFGYSLDALESLEIRYHRETIRHSGAISPGDDFFSLCMRARDDYTVIIRMGSYDNSWSWEDIVALLPCSKINTLVFSNPDDSHCDHALPPVSLLRELRGLQHVTLSDRQNIHFLNNLPLGAPISTIVASLPSGTNNEDLSDIWHCLDKRDVDREPITLILDGVLNTTKDIKRYRHLEMPLLVALTEFAVVKDRRTYKQVR